MRIIAAVAEQVLLLHGDAHRGGEFVDALGRLGRDVVRAVPSCLAVTITHTRSGEEVGVSMAAGPAEVLASLAVSLSGAPGDLLVLRAGAAGAFVLLAGDLDGLLGPDHPPARLDEHLGWPSVAGAEPLGASLADLSAVDQALGVLVDRGLPPDAASRELGRWAGEAGTTLAAASRELLASLRSHPGRS